VIGVEHGVIVATANTVNARGRELANSSEGTMKPIGVWLARVVLVLTRNLALAINWLLVAHCAPSKSF
jgi:hypothetical protein